MSAPTARSAARPATCSSPRCAPSRRSSARASSPSGGQQQQQQQQQQGSNAQQAEKLAELQKQIINATWKVIRRETGDSPPTQFVPDVKLIGESQAVGPRAGRGLEEKLKDEKSKRILEES